MRALANTTVRDLRPEDWPHVAAAFADGIRSGNATFETEPPSWEDWSAAHTLGRALTRVGPLLLSRRR
jgi:L-amino acid N-acyltransferase YncA